MLMFDVIHAKFCFIGLTPKCPVFQLLQDSNLVVTISFEVHFCFNQDLKERVNLEMKLLTDCQSISSISLPMYLSAAQQMASRINCLKIAEVGLSNSKIFPSVPSFLARSLRTIIICELKISDKKDKKSDIA